MKKKVLLIMSRSPYPPIGGDKLKSFNLLKILAKNYDVHLVIITDEFINEEVRSELERYTYKLKIFIKSKYKFYLNALKFLINKKPLQVNYYYFRDVQKYIDNIVDQIDFAIPVLIRTSEYLKNFNKVKYLDMVDSIGLNYKRSKNNVKSLFWKIVYYLETDRLLEYETHCVKNFNNTFFVNKFESDYWSKYGNTTWIPNGVNENLFYYNKKDFKYKNCIVFFGKMDYQPNIDAVKWFVSNVLEKLNKDLKFIIVGTHPTNSVLKLTKKYSNIKVTGFVEDPYLILNSSLCVVAPMQTGGGIQNKVLESMALGTINIVSSLCAKPIIGAENKKHFLVSDDGNEMAFIINDIYKNSILYKDIKINARNFIKNNYTWKHYESKLLKTITPYPLSSSR